MAPIDPLVRVVIVNYNGGDLTLRCIESVKASDWLLDRLEIVVVDNASHDGSPEAVEREHPDVRLVRTPRNLGYAAANNLALLDLASVDYIALLNNDAVVGQRWLRPLVAALEADAGLGAVAPKILFEPVFEELALEAPISPHRRGDSRRLGVRLSGIRVGGRDRWPEAQFASGWHYPEYGRSLASSFRWSEAHALLRIPQPDDGSMSAELLIASDREKTVAVVSGGVCTRVEVGPRPTWIEAPLGGEPLNIVNSVGSVLLRGGYGADRGMLEADRDQYDQPAEVFAWCGCSALLRREYLEDVGLLEPRFFLYYEDLDLSWRGRARGWRYRYVPAATVRHHHAASTVEGSALFQHYVERNRLLVHARNAPATYALRVGCRFVWEILRQVRRDLVRPALQLQRPRLVFVNRRLRSLGAFAWHLPPTLRARRNLRGRQRVPDEDLLRWLDVR
jgi:GT2 family glycosyltransferase